MSLTTRLVGAAASAAITLGAFSIAAYADDVPTTTDPCATRQAQVDRATEALARVTAVFARQQERVEAAKEDVAEAEDDSEKAAAKQELKAAKAAKAETKVTHRAQQMRLAKATERLTTCQADNAPTTEAPVPS